MNTKRIFPWLLIGILTTAGIQAASPSQETALVEAIECRPRAGLPNVLAKLEAGKTVRVAYLGGSITVANGWRVYTTNWLRKKYPNARIEEINAAIGGTGSTLGVFRNRKDVLAHKPDLLFIEFAVNDSREPPAEIKSNMEGLVRQTWAVDPNTDICFVYTLHEIFLPDLNRGKFNASASTMEAVANHYNIPSIHMGLEAVRLVKEGKWVFTGSPAGAKPGFAGDGCHPHSATGHKLYVEAIQRSFLQFPQSAATPHALPQPLCDYHKASAHLAQLSTLNPVGFVPNPSLSAQFKRFMPKILTAKPGATLTIKFKGTAIGFFDLMGPDCGELAYSVDGGPERKIRRFDKYCIYHRLSWFMAALNLPDDEHTVTVKVLPTKLDKAAILKQLGNKMSPPERFTDTNWHVGNILLVGELIPFANTKAKQ